MDEIKKIIGASKPELSEVLTELKLETLKAVNAINIGIIESFDAGDQTATIRMALKQVKSIKADGTKIFVEHPLLVKCPVVVLYGGGSYLTFPIAPGDNCLVLFNDREIDQWFQSGGVQAPVSGRLHDMSDGIALVGIRSLQKSIANYLTNGIRLQFNADSNIELLEDAINSVAELWTHTGDMLLDGSLEITGHMTGTGGTLTVDSDVVLSGSHSLQVGNGATGNFNTVNVVKGIVVSGT